MREFGQTGGAEEQFWLRLCPEALRRTAHCSLAYFLPHLFPEISPGAALWH